MVGLDRAAGALALGSAERIGAQHPIAHQSFGNKSDMVPAPFSGVFKGIVEQTQTLGKAASDAVTGLLNGQGVEIHDVMIAQQKADASFELALQVRNKAVSAYQQLLGMQF